MTTLLWDHSIREFIEQASSSSPTPGGGGVAALVAALGTSMISMVSHLSQGDKYASIEHQIRDVLAKMDRLNAQFEQLLYDDAASFNQYMDAFKLPKTSDEEKLKRANILHAAAVHAIEVPLQLMKACMEGMNCVMAIAETSNRNLISDLGIAAILLEAAVQSSLLTVEINLASLKDEQLKQHYANESISIVVEVKRLKEKCLDIVRKRISQ